MEIILFPFALSVESVQEMFTKIYRNQDYVFGTTVKSAESPNSFPSANRTGPDKAAVPELFASKSRETTTMPFHERSGSYEKKKKITYVFPMTLPNLT